MRVIKNKSVVNDDWLLVRAENGEVSRDDLPAEGNMIVPFLFWQSHQNEMQEHDGEVAVYIDGAVDVEAIAAVADQFKLIAVDFPAFADGRCYSHARLLKERYQYQGEIRAIGDVLRDQLFYMQRCGIDSFELRSDKDAEDALKAFNDFTVRYQSAADGSQPIYRLR